MDQKTATKLLRKAMTLTQAGKPREARQAVAKVLKAYPGQPDALHMTGVAYLAEGQLAPAEKALRAALAARPGDTVCQINLAITLHRADRPVEALTLAQDALKKAPGHPQALDVVAGAALASDDRETAAGALAALCRVLPRDPGPRVGLGEVLTGLGRTSAAAEAFREALALRPDTLPALVGLTRLGPPAVLATEALRAVERAASLAPRDSGLTALHAAYLEQANRLEEAAKAVEAALSLDPREPTALLTRARLAMRRGDLDAARATLAAAGAEDGDPALAAQLAWVQAQIADREGDATAARQAMEQAHALHRQTPQAQAARRSVLYDRAAAYRTLLKDRPPAAPRPVAPDQPIFFVGYPRSGTTLMEQILAAHPALVTTAEEPFLSRVIMDLPSLIGRPYRHPVDLPTLTDAEAAKAARHYVSIAEASLGPLEGRRIVDKLPLNLVELPFAERLFPGAAVIVAIRDPRDVVLSNVMQLFAPNASSIHSDSVDGCAKAYALAMDLWEDYARTLALPRLVYRYEDLVSDFGGTIRAVIDFLGLPWDSSILDFDAKARGRHIMTPSYTRAISKPDTASIGRWRRYEEWLAPALPVLADCVARYGYDRA